jgi:hypothetical protein
MLLFQMRSGFLSLLRSAEKRDDGVANEVKLEIGTAVPNVPSPLPGTKMRACPDCPWLGAVE